jgi:hypothetical protein
MFTLLLLPIVMVLFTGGVLHGVDCKKNGTWVRRAAYETFRKIPMAKYEATENLKLISNPDGTIADWVNEKTRHSKIMKGAANNFKVSLVSIFLLSYCTVECFCMLRPSFTHSMSVKK